MAEYRAGKTTLRTVEVEAKPAPEVSADELKAIREKLKLSRPVFAHYLRTNPRTLENWEQGRAKPNAQAALLILQRCDLGFEFSDALIQVLSHLLMISDLTAAVKSDEPMVVFQMGVAAAFKLCRPWS